MSILKIEKLNTYYGKSHILQGVDFDLNKTGCLALLGRNGAGKSTTLRSIVNLTKPVSGKITFNNIGASITAKVGSGEGLPPRVAKFVVSSVDAQGTITSLQIIDRGIYKQFPADNLFIQDKLSQRGVYKALDGTIGKMYWEKI